MFEIPKYNLFKPEKGKILLSEPFLSDNYFSRSVILLTEHNDEGTIGFILNKASDIKLNEAVDNFPSFKADIFFGGPVNKHNLFFLHTIGSKVEGAVEVLPGLFWGGNFEQLKSLVSGKTVDPEQLRFFAGYAGWAPGQLDKELEENSWIVCETSLDLLWSNKNKNLWAKVLQTLGPEYAQLANFPIDPNLN